MISFSLATQNLGFWNGGNFEFGKGSMIIGIFVGFYYRCFSNFYVRYLRS